MTVAARIASCGRFWSGPQPCLSLPSRVSHGDVLLFPTRRSVWPWFFLKDVLCVSALPDSCLSPDTPLFSSERVYWCRHQSCGVPAGELGGPSRWRLFSPTLALRAPGFVCTSLLHGPVTAQNSSGLSVLRHTGIKRNCGRDLSTLSLAHEGEPPDASVKVRRPEGSVAWFILALLLSGHCHPGPRI